MLQREREREREREKLWSNKLKVNEREGAVVTRKMVNQRNKKLLSDNFTAVQYK